MANAAAHLEHVVDVLRRHRLSVDAFDVDQVGTAYALGWQDAATDWLGFAVDLLEDRCSPFDQPTPPAATEEDRARMPDDHPTTAIPEVTPFAGYAILELMGHRRLAGYVREVELAGAGVLRLDVPDSEYLGGQLDPSDPAHWTATQFYAPAALYCLTPTTEAAARRVAAGADPAPVKAWELPARPERAPAGPPDGYWDPDDEDLDEHERDRDARIVP